MVSEKMRHRNRFIHLSAVLIAMAWMSGCSLIYKTTGDILVGYGRAEMTPYLLKLDDIDMACATGVSLTPFLASFESVHSDPDRLVVLTYSLAAACAQEQAQEQALRYQRATREGRAAEAQDARTLEKRYAVLAAQRLETSHERMKSVYGEVGPARCPRLRTEFDELVFMVGWLNGIQAMLYDTAAGGSEGVPRSIAGNARHAAACLDNKKWWGVPRAMRASVEAILPALAPEDAEPWAVLEESVQQGYQSGVRLSSALYVTAAYSTDNRERLREGIREFAAHGDNLDDRYAMLDAMAAFMIRGISDRLWTRETGRRTPFGELGHFHDEPSGSDVDIEDLL